MKRKYVNTAILLILLVICSGVFVRYEISQPSVRFSAKEAFQKEAFRLSMSSGLFGGQIYYTLDGSDPTLESNIYTEPILIEEGLPLQVTVVKAAMLQGGVLGDIHTQTYFVGETVEDLFDTMVVSLSVNEQHLYNEETGIFANYLESSEEGEWDRPAYVEFYDSDGTQMMAQGTGIAVSGHGSRNYEQKSIKLISDSIYDREHPTFEYDFFETDMAGNTESQSYNRLVLRNGGSDHAGTMLKWNVVSRLGKEAGIICAGARPGVLFLNGEYYGIIQLQEKYTRYNVASAIGAQKDDIEKYEPNEVNSARFGGYYNRLHADLNDPERQIRLEASVDMMDMLRYYAVNVIMNNNDWPYHNFLSWKCASGSASAYGDGKVRFFLYDLDAVYQNTEGMEIENVFDYLMEDPLADSYDTLWILMQSDKYRTQFVNLVCDLLNTVYDEDHVLQIIAEENQKLQNSMNLYYSEQIQERQKAAVEKMKTAVSRSFEATHAGLQKHLGADMPYRLSVEAPEGYDIHFSQIQIESGKNYKGIYYHNYPLTLVAEAVNGQEFYGWLVNGEKVSDQELLLDERYDADELHIQLITEP